MFAHYVWGYFSISRENFEISMDFLIWRQSRYPTGMAEDASPGISDAQELRQEKSSQDSKKGFRIYIVSWNVASWAKALALIRTYHGSYP